VYFLKRQGRTGPAFFVNIQIFCVDFFTQMFMLPRANKAKNFILNADFCYYAQSEAVCNKLFMMSIT